MDLIEYPDSEMMMMQLTDRLVGEITKCLASHDHVSFAVPGGSTPGPVFDTLSGSDLQWDRVHVLLTDERRVPADHERSNERLLRKRLLTDKAAAAQFIRLVPSPGVSMEDLNDRIAPELPLSILLLGMGADMHCASLFPGSPQLADALAPKAPHVMEVDAPEGLEPRITLTGPVLRGAMSTHVLITGDEKREAVERARRMKPQEAPIATVLNEATVHWAKE
ncbi:6-phosphogluconolactonase [Palleronia marisminoris]|uniref:6-phosphogluconolactonase n=1 Tax=Palleronia marisminoris TaxID=315423 RepID=A0A1Y5RHA7_9RHOB|nr:6-phosphogluconolactonase [Palleronia marisminoris]SFG20241.1 6-phosphogluconolactonase [Palleronia marisminoris]SLN17325.1 6-phosphogluconolactonase [Palleronia marisminoris]